MKIKCETISISLANYTIQDYKAYKIFLFFIVTNVFNSIIVIGNKQIIF